VIVKFDEIPEDGLALHLTETAWIPGEEISWQGPVDASIFLGKNGERILCEGSLRLTLLLDCDRCLEQFAAPLETEFKIDFELLPADLAQQDFASEHECSEAEMDVVYLEEPLIDIHATLAQQLYLAMPEKRLCGEECQGLCPVCGVNRNLEQCDCAKKSGLSPFGVLARLKH